MMCYFCPLHTRQLMTISNMITVMTGPNLTESGPKPDLGFAFRVQWGLLERTQSGPRPDPVQTQSKPLADHDWTPSKPGKRTPISESNP